MSGRIAHQPKWLREEAERYFRLAYSLTAQRDYDTVMDYGQELLHRAEQIEIAYQGLPHARQNELPQIES